MQAGMLRWFVLAVGTLAVASCGHRAPARQPPVFYDDRGDPSEEATALSERELREITVWAAIQTRDPVWLVRVKPSEAGEGRGVVIAHIVPDEMTPRIRVGRAYSVPKSKKRTAIYSPARYIQISMPDHTFTKELVKPPPSELPFDWPRVYDPNTREESRMSKEEVLAIVDFVHQPSSYKELTASQGASADNMVQEILHSPIFQIERSGSQIEVQLGFMHGLMWGYGVEVTLEYTPIGYKVKTWGSWIS